LLVLDERFRKGQGVGVGSTDFISAGIYTIPEAARLTPNSKIEQA
jgi:hypothetical protein